MTPRFALRDFATGFGLFAATVCVVLWQNAHIAVLWDTSYVLDSAVRIAAGQMPYRDFPFVHAPLTFLVQAAIIRFTGRVFFHHVIYVAVVGGLGTVITWRLALASLRGQAEAGSWRGRNANWPIALLVAAPLIFLGIYSIIPIPEYDCDCAFWILVALWLLQRADGKRTLASGLIAGAGICVPPFFKQNMGLPFLVMAIGAVVLVLANLLMQAKRGADDAPEMRTLLSILAGACVTLVAVAIALHWTAGIRNYIHWTIEYAGQRRLPGFGDMLAIYRDPSLMWTLPCVGIALATLWLAPQKFRWAQLAAFALLAAPFLFAWLTADLRRCRRARRQLAGALAVAAFARGGAGACEFVRLRKEPSLRALFPAHDARRHQRNLDVAAALGIDVRHLAAARVAAGGDACVSRFLRGARGRTHARIVCSGARRTHFGHAAGVRGVLHGQRGATFLREVS